jgi:hypothetical protein
LGFFSPVLARFFTFSRRQQIKASKRFKHAEHGHRYSLELLGLCKPYGKDRLEAVFALELTLGTCQYWHIKGTRVKFFQ